MAKEVLPSPGLADGHGCDRAVMNRSSAFGRHRHPLARLAVYTGLRRGEILRLDRQHVMGDLIILDTHTKSGEPRRVPAPAPVRPLLARIPFPFTAFVLRREFEAAPMKLGIPEFRFPDLRHSYAAVLVQRGVERKMVGALLGHSSTA